MRPISWLSRVVGVGASFLYFAVFAITIYDVAARYMFDQPTVWGLELVIALAALQYVLGGAQALRDDAHVRIDVIYLKMPHRVRKVMDILSYTITIVFLAIIVWYGAIQAHTSWMRGETSGAGWNSHAPMVMKIAIPVGAALMLLQAAELLIRRCREFRDAG